jgi:hypothetical protein
VQLIQRKLTLKVLMRFVVDNPEPSNNMRLFTRAGWTAFPILNVRLSVL